MFEFPNVSHVFKQTISLRTTDAPNIWQKNIASVVHKICIVCSEANILSWIDVNSTPLESLESELFA